MGVIQSGINQAIQTAAIIGQLQELPQKKTERKITAAELDKIEKEKEQAKEYFSAIKDEKTLADQQELKEEIWTPEAKKYYSDLRDREISLRDRYKKAGGKEGKYIPDIIDPQDKASEISLGEKWPGYNSLEYEYGIPTITDKDLKEEQKSLVQGTKEWDAVTKRINDTINATIRLKNAINNYGTEFDKVTLKNIENWLILHNKN